MHGLAVALSLAAGLGHCKRNPAEVERLAIEDSFCAAIRTAREQKSVSLAKRAEANYAEYRRKKASGSGERGFRLPLS